MGEGNSYYEGIAGRLAHGSAYHAIARDDSAEGDPGESDQLDSLCGLVSAPDSAWWFATERPDVGCEHCQRRMGVSL